MVDARGSSDPNAGLFIVLEGLDGAGTTTQLAHVSNALAQLGIDVEVTREPSDGSFGKLLRAVLERHYEVDPHALALAFAADRIDHLRSADGGVEARLDEGAWVISDRYVLSSLAYQASQGVDLEWLVSINGVARKPDVTIFVDTPVHVCMERIRERGDEFRDLFHAEDHLAQVEQFYRKILGRPDMTGDLITADGRGSVEVVADQICRGLAAFLRRRGEPTLANSVQFASRPS